MSDDVVFIPDSGACITTRSVLEGKTPIKWLTREWPVNPQDNGWRIFGLDDTEEYLADPANLVITTYNHLCNIEPMLISVYDFGVGADFQIVKDEDGIAIVDTPTGVEIPEEEYYEPGMTPRDRGERTPRYRGDDPKPKRGLFRRRKG